MASKPLDLLITENGDLDPGPSWVRWQATCRCSRIRRMGGGNQRVCSGGQRMSRQTCGHLGGVGWPRHVPTGYVIEFPSGTKTFSSSIQFQISYIYTISFRYVYISNISQISKISNISLCMPWPAPRAPTCSGSSGIGSTAAVGGVAAVAGFRGALRWQPLGERKLFQLTVW